MKFKRIIRLSLSSILILIFFVSIFTNYALASDFNLNRVVDFNYPPIPGGVGNFTNINSPMISAGQIVFRGFGNNSQRGIYLSNGGGLSVVADKHTAIPNGVGNFTDFSHLPTIDNGKIVFSASGSGGQTGIYLSSEGRLSVLCDKNTPDPNGSGHLSGFGNMIAIDGSNIVFDALDSNNNRNYYARIGNTVQRIIGNGDLFNGKVVGRDLYINTWVNNFRGNLFTFVTAPPLSDPDVVNTVGGVYLANLITGEFIKIADTNTSIPGGSGTFSIFATAVIDNDGQMVVFFGRAGNHMGLYTSMGGILSVVVDTNTAIPNGPGNFQATEDPSISNRKIAFHGTLGSGTGSFAGIYFADSGKLSVVADTNTPVPNGIGNFPISLSIPSIDKNTVAFQSYGVRLPNYSVGQGIYLAQRSNTPPVANTGPNQTVHVGTLAALDGSGSYDPDNNVPLFYAWNIIDKPASSVAVLSNPAIVNPTFSPDVPGDYIVELVVTDSLGAQSTPATVTVSTTNTPPIAEAGPNQFILRIGSTVQLDGSQSYDPDGDSPLTYQWTFKSQPEGGSAALSNTDAKTPTFVADVHGTYVIELVVSDPWVSSSPDTVTVSFENVKPVANAGTSRSAEIFQTVTLDGNGSYDANGDLLTYQWSIVSGPLGSTAVIEDSSAMVASFIPDKEGTYVIQLMVNDGFVDSDPSPIQIEVVVYPTTVTQWVQETQEIVITIPLASFKNNNMKNTLLNKLNAVIISIQAGDYTAALGQIEGDILGKTDGCATTGAPDRNDWIKTCQEQDQIYPVIMEIIYLLRSLMY
jgi:hypothetical protein